MVPNSITPLNLISSLHKAFLGSASPAVRVTQHGHPNALIITALHSITSDVQLPLPLYTTPSDTITASDVPVETQFRVRSIIRRFTLSEGNGCQHSLAGATSTIAEQIHERKHQAAATGMPSPGGTSMTRPTSRASTRRIRYLSSI